MRLFTTKSAVQLCSIKKQHPIQLVQEMFIIMMVKKMDQLRNKIKIMRKFKSHMFNFFLYVHNKLLASNQIKR